MFSWLRTKRSLDTVVGRENVNVKTARQSQNADHLDNPQGQASSSASVISSMDVDKFKSAVQEIEELRSSARKAVTLAEKTHSLVILGFFVLLVMILGLLLDHFSFVFGSGLELLSAEQQQITAQKEQIDLLKQEQLNLKKCLAAGSWAGCFQ